MRTQIGGFGTALNAYELDLGHYPSSLQSLLQAPSGRNSSKWSGPYLNGEVVPNDPWGNPYHYRFPGQRVPGSYDIWSAGPDGIDGTEDDIGNWQASPFPVNRATAAEKAAFPASDQKAAAPAPAPADRK